MLFWFLLRRNFGRIVAFCLGPFGSTVIFAVVTGALVYRLGWFGMGMAGLMGLLVSTRLSEGENAGHRIPGTHLNFRPLHPLIGAPPGQTRRRRHRDRPEEDPRTRKPSDSLQLVSASSLAMMAIGFFMFLRYQI